MNATTYPPNPRTLSHCRSCGAEIAWACTLRNRRLAPYDLDGTPHFATCPDRDKWRRR